MQMTFLGGLRRAESLCGVAKGELMLSSTSPPSLRLCAPTQHHPNKIPPQKSRIPLHRADYSNGSLRFCWNRKWVPSQSRFVAKSAGTDAETDQKSDQVSEEVKNGSSGGGSPSRSFLSILCPLLKLFGGGDPSQQRNEVLEVATSSLSSLARLPWGSTSLAGSDQNEERLESPKLYLQLFEFEACPFCRRVREAMTELDLSLEVYPCPKGSTRHREMVRKIGGKEQFPLLVDPNTGVSMYESGDIVKYLFQQYGHGRNPSFGLLESTLFTGWMPTLLRAGRGMTLWERAGKEPLSKLLELFSYENNLYSRIVREALCELELPYLLHNVGKGSSKFELLAHLSGSKMVPYLIDPNTGMQTGDYKKILSYLFQTYSTAK